MHEPLFPGLIDVELWRADIYADIPCEPLVMVRLRNAMREPDGSFRLSWLRVPPRMQTAHEAVAWTFGMSENEYAPHVET